MHSPVVMRCFGFETERQFSRKEIRERGAESLSWFATHFLHLMQNVKTT